MRTKTAITLLIAATCTVSAFAKADRSFKALDTDNDGKITKTKFTANVTRKKFVDSLTAQFIAADKNKDDMLDSSEYSK